MINEFDLNRIYTINFHDNKDDRGRLTAIEFGNHVPFEIKRIFYVHQVIRERGSHAHRDTDQVLTTVHGSLKVDISNGVETRTFNIDNPGQGIYIPKMFWIRLYDFSPGGVCLVVASTIYDMKRSLRTWDDYIKARELPWIEPPGSKKVKNG